MARVTIAEVARAAGVSKTTVSAVLNGSAATLGIRESTRASVLEACNRLDYTPNHAARSLRSQRTQILTLLVQDLANPCFIDIAVAARNAAEARGFELDVVNAGPPDAELRALRNLRGGRTDGVIVATGRHGSRAQAVELLQDLARLGRAVVVLIDRSPAPRIPAISVDVEAGAYAAVQHLLQLGHRRIAHVALHGAEPIEAEQTSQGDRYRGYRRALADARIEPDPAWLIRGPDTLAGGRAMIGQLLDRPGPRPTAVLVYNDLTAIGVLHGLREAGLRVPDDMAVIGTDGIELGGYTAPPLTTIDHPRHELGRLGIETLFALLDGERPEELERVLPTRLIIRESCGGNVRVQPQGRMR